MSEAGEASTRNHRWQVKLLPFMTGSLVALAACFFAATLWNYSSLQGQLQRPVSDIQGVLDRLPKMDASQKQWYVSAVLEEQSLRSRHQQNGAVVSASIWTRFMGFMTGMVLVIAGSVFILGKLESTFEGNANLNGYQGSLTTTSPGLVLAVAGTLLIGISLLMKVEVQIDDRPVYLPGHSYEQKPPKPAPVDFEQAAASSPASAGPGAAAASSPPAFPPEVLRQMCKDSSSARSDQCKGVSQ